MVVARSGDKGGKSTDTEKTNQVLTHRGESSREVAEIVGSTTTNIDQEGPVGSWVTSPSSKYKGDVETTDA